MQKFVGLFLPIYRQTGISKSMVRLKDFTFDFPRTVKNQAFNIL